MYIRCVSSLEENIFLAVISRKKYHPSAVTMEASDIRVVPSNDTDVTASTGKGDLNRGTPGSDGENDGEENLIYLTDRSGHTLRRVLYRDMLHIPFPKLRRKIENMDMIQIRPDDILIAAAPRCGTHWVWEIVRMLLRGSAEFIPGEKEELFLEASSPENIERAASPRVLNTHLFPSFITPTMIDGRCKIFFVTRNPKDALVSDYLLNRGSSIINYQGEFVDFLRVLHTKYPDKIMGTWMEYIKAWEAHFKDHPELSVLILYYEDLKEDLCREVRSIADFLSLEVGDQLVTEISDRCTFDNMKAGKAAVNPGGHHMSGKGQVGRWKEYFTVAINEEYDQQYKEEMADSQIAARIRFSI